MTDKRSPDPFAELHEYQEKREQMLQEHEQLLQRMRHRPAAGDSGNDAATSLLSRFEELQCLVDVQRRKIGDLLGIEKSYNELNRQFKVIEMTNQKLVQQLLLFSDLDERKKELESLVDKQQKELQSARTHLREARTRIDSLRTRLLLLEDENAHLANQMEDYRMRLENLLEKDERDSKQLKRLQDELKRSREAYELQHRKYLKMRDEYETMYRKK